METTEEPGAERASPQRGAPGSEGAAGGELERSSTGLDANVAALLCYLLGVVTGILFLVVERRSEFVRFHAVQSTVTFGSLLLIQIFSGFIPIVGHIIAALVAPLSFVLWLLLMWKSYQGEHFALPLAGDVAEEHSALPR